MRAPILLGPLIAIGLTANGVAATDIPLPVRKPNVTAMAPPPANWSAEEIAFAQDQCAKLIVPIDLVFAPLPPIKEKACGTPVPLLLSKIGSNPEISIHPPATVNCALAERFGAWLKESVAPLAKAVLKSPILEIHVVASYACRNRYNDPNKRLSEHAKANALDITAFRTADGEWIRVLDHWGLTHRDVLARAEAEAKAAKTAKKSISGSEPATPSPSGELTEQPSEASLPIVLTMQEPTGLKLNSAPPSTTTPNSVSEEPEEPVEPADERRVFIRKIHADACRYFGTVLGPEANDAHRNHFHLDLAPRKRKAYCE